MKDLKPCPFCKGDAKIEHSYREDDHRCPRDFWHARVVCVGECGMEREWIRYGRQENENNDPVAKSEIEEILVTEWNRRPIEDALRAEIDALLFEWNLMVKTIGAKTHGTAIGEAGQIVRERDALRASLAGLQSAYDNLTQEHHYDHHVTIPALVEGLRGTGKILERMDRAGSWGVLVDIGYLQALEAKAQKLEEERNIARQLCRAAHETAELAWGGAIPSPLPGHRRQTEEEFAAEMARLNCPLCGGSGHVDDADQAVVAKIKGLEAKVQRLEAVRVAAEDVLVDRDPPSMADLEDALQAAGEGEA